jgi:predicted GIY-YIG superfamily endonuclease
MDKLWFNYIIFENKNKTYIGSTVDIDRRIRQHNGIIKGGAKYTRNGIWNYYCVLFDLNHSKRSALSDEWHLKHIKFKTKSYSNTKNIKLPIKKRIYALEQYLIHKSFKKYDHILFIAKKYMMLTPLLPTSILIIYLEEINMNIINNYISIIKNINYLF